MRNRTDFGAKHCCEVCLKYFIFKYYDIIEIQCCASVMLLSVKLPFELLHTLIKYINCI